MKTNKPELRTGLVTNVDSQMRDLIRQVSDMHGVGVVTQTENDSHVPIRVNVKNLKLEAYIGGEWKVVG